MKKLTFYSILLILFFVTSCKTGEKNKENVEFNEVSEDYFFPEEVPYNQSVTEVLADKLYPIGWSKNGNFAYLIEPADEGLGNYMVGIVIMSLVSNEVLWDWYTDPVVDEDLFREDIWQKHYKDFKEKLNKYGIIQQRNIKISDSYFTYKDKDFILKLESDKTTDQDLGINVVTKSKLFIKSPKLGEKLVSDKKYEASMILGQYISGCIISPYENRVAIIVRSERWGYEGPPNLVEFEIFGTNLSTGFQKKK